MRKAVLWVCTVATSWLASGAVAAEHSPATPGCAGGGAKECVGLALEAMGGREHLQQVQSVRLDTIGHTLLMEQSYRQDPFITSYERDLTTLDLVNHRLLTEAKQTWPESDANQSDSESTLVVGPDGGVYRGKGGDSACSLADLDAAAQMLALGPVRLLLSALDAPDLHFEAPATLRSTSHPVVAFTWRKTPVRVLLNPFNHLPDAVETTQEFHDFWYFWGDVEQRFYFDNFKLVQGIVFPTNIIEERNGLVWSSEQALNVEFNVPLDEKAFSMDAKIAKISAGQPGWNRAFHAKTGTALAGGLDLFPGAWNSTIVKVPEGIVILEAPISGLYTQGVIDEARRRYPTDPIVAVLSTSDSWPHTGGVRAAVADGLPIYILDLNQPLLDRMMAAPHTIDPDALQMVKDGNGANAASTSTPSGAAGASGEPVSSAASGTPSWKIVAGKIEIGSDANRLELYPLRGASTERQYMVYFPQHHLLYASDTLALNDDGSLYDPELMHEVAQAVARENLQVETVFAMHQGPIPWTQVTAALEKAQK